MPGFTLSARWTCFHSRLAAPGEEKEPLRTELLGKEVLALAPELGGSGTERRWEALTWPEGRDAAAALNAVTVPVGAIEQHGPHLPLAVDTLIGEAVALGVSALAGVPVVRGLCFG